MKSYKITEEEIEQLDRLAKNEAHQLISNDIRNWFPEVFETKLEVGKWYNQKDNDCLYFVTRIKDDEMYCYGFNYLGEWKNEKVFGLLAEVINDVFPAAEKEVKEALIKEAKRRGFKEGVKFININGYKEIADFNPDNTSNTFFWEQQDESYFNMALKESGGCIFKNGKWAEIIEEEIKVVENEEPSPRYTVTFETIGAVTVILEGNNLDNLMAIAKDSKLR